MVMIRRPSRVVAALTVAAGLLLSAMAGCAADTPPPGERPPVTAHQAPPPSAAAAPVDDEVEQQLAALERQTGARLGLYAVDTATGASVEHRADERFAMASTAKALSAAVLLDATDGSALDTVVPVDAEDLVPYSPITETRAGAGISLREAAAAAVTTSDNTAENLVLDRIGGPGGLRAALRTIGDTTTEPAREEPALNAVVPGDPRDTTTPRALATSLQAYAVGGRLSAQDSDQLVAWLRASTTGAELVRAGVPDGWDVGDKSGSASGYGSRNDLALVWPPGRPDTAPWVVAVLTDKTGPTDEPAPHLVAQATTVVVDALRHPRRR